MLWLLQVFKLTAKWNKAPEVQPCTGDDATALEPAVNGSGVSVGAPHLRQGLAVQVGSKSKAATAGSTGSFMRVVVTQSEYGQQILVSKRNPDPGL